MNSSFRFLATPQGVVLATAIVFALVLSLLNPAFFSPATLVDLLRNSLVTGIFALGVMMVLASGGIDVSCTAIGAFAMYATMKIILGIDVDVPIIVFFALSASIGASLGLINGLLIGGLGLPTLIVTLGTLSLFRGALLTFLGTVYITSVPREVIQFSRKVFVRLENAAGQMVSLPMSFIVLVAAEFVATKAGIGYMIWNSWELLQVDVMFCGIVTVGVLGLIATVILQEIERKVIPWKAE